MIEIKRYKGEKELWDNFVKNSKNGVFFFLRDYMEYHADRFEDHSLIFLNIKRFSIESNENMLILHLKTLFGCLKTNLRR